MDTQKLVAALLVAGGLIAAVAVAAMIILRLNKERKPQERPKTPDPKLLGAIRSRAENFERNALAYYLWREANRRHLDRRRAQEIFATYGEVVACPVMDLSDLYGIGKVSSREVRGAAATWLQGEGLAINPEDSVSESLGIPLKKRASLRAAAIIDAGETSEDNDRVARGRNEGTNAEGFGADRTALGGRPHLIH